jgi:hypothetical protein
VVSVGLFSRGSALGAGSTIRRPCCLTKSGVSSGAAGVRRALFAYNHVDWYVNDVLYYASSYGGGTVPGDTNNACGPGRGGNRNLPSLTGKRVAKLLTWAKRHDGDRYRMAPARTLGIALVSPKPPMPKLASRYPAPPPRNATGSPPATAPRVQPGQENPATMIIWNLANKTTIEARGTRAGVKHLSYANGRSHHIFEIWRVGNLGGGP